jgi:hypothetical protein
MVCLMERGFTKGENVTIQHLTVPLCWDRPFDSGFTSKLVHPHLRSGKSNTSRHRDFVIISTTDFELDHRP